MSTSPSVPNAEPDPRYPIGRFQRSATAITEADRSAAIETIATLPTHLRSAVSGWTNAQLDTAYREGGWTVRQLIHHLADSHMQISSRVRMALAENNPTILPYDENAFAELPDAKQGHIECSLSILDGVHARWSYLLHHLTQEQWQRTFVHPETGTWTLDAATQLYAWHSRHHLAHIAELKKVKGW